MAQNCFLILLEFGYTFRSWTRICEGAHENSYFIAGSLSSFSLTFEVTQKYFIWIIPHKINLKISSSVTNSEKNLVGSFSILHLMNKKNFLVTFCNRALQLSVILTIFTYLYKGKQTIKSFRFCLKIFFIFHIYKLIWIKVLNNYKFI